jgi:hypothetical protein
MTITPGPEWQQRVFTERDELKERLLKLEDYLHTEASYAIDQRDRNLLVSQRHHMILYLHVLDMRIARFA